MGTRVLLIESDEGLRSSITRALRARGVGVDAYATGTEALEAVKGGQVWSRSLIDLELSDRDGATLAEQLLDHLPELEVTFAAGGADAQVLCRAHALGSVLWKPLGLGPLCERFGTVVKRSGVVMRANAAAVARARKAAGTGTTG